MFESLFRKCSYREISTVCFSMHTAALQYQISAHKFNKEQIDLITNSLMRVFCSKNMDVSVCVCVCVGVLIPVYV